MAVNAVSSRNDAARVNMNDVFIRFVANGTWTKQFKFGQKDNSLPVTRKIDTGTQANILPLAVTRKLGTNIIANDFRLVTYSKEYNPVIRKIILNLHTDDVNHRPVLYELVDGDVGAILGLVSCVTSGVVSRVNAVTSQSILGEFPDCFEGIGCLSRERKTAVDPQD